MVICRCEGQDILAEAVKGGVLVASWPRLDADQLEGILDPLLEAWPIVRLEKYKDCVGLKFSRPTDEEAGTFSFAGAGVYVTCTEGDYRLHQVAVNNNGQV